MATRPFPVFAAAILALGLGASTRALAEPTPTPAPAAPAATGAPAEPAAQPTPAFIILDVPAAPDRAEAEYGARGLAYDTETKITPPSQNANVAVAGTLTLIKTDAPTPLAEGATYPLLLVREEDRVHATTRRITFRDVKIIKVVQDASEGVARITFSAGRVDVST